MNLEALRTQFREEADDKIAPYLFSDDQILAWLNEAEDEAAARARLLAEYSDPAICSITVTANQPTYATHEAVLDITRAAFTPTGGDSTVLFITDRTELDRIKPDWRTSTDEPEYLVQDDTKVQIVPTPTVAGSLDIECNRLPITPMASDADTPEIARAHHRYLVHWALHRAFSLPDTETVDPKKAASGEAAFTAYFGIRPDADTRKATQANRPHHNQTHW